MTVYRSAHGKPVDIAQLATKFEKVRAVGNMNVNARGDVIDNNNKVVKDNSSRVKNSYSNSIGKNPVAQKSKAPAPVQAPAYTNTVTTTPPPAPDLSKHEQELFDELDEFNEEELQEIKAQEKE